jgi:hypothetical protein
MLFTTTASKQNSCYYILLLLTKERTLKSLLTKEEDFLSLSMNHGYSTLRIFGTLKNSPSCSGALLSMASLSG